MRFAISLLLLALAFASIVGAAPLSTTGSELSLGAGPDAFPSAAGPVDASAPSLGCAADIPQAQCSIIAANAAAKVRKQAIAKSQSSKSKVYTGRAAYHHTSAHHSYCNIRIADDALVVSVNSDQFHDRSTRGGPICGSYLKITNKLNGNQVLARVADYTDYAKYGSLDVTVAVAQALGSIEEMAVPVSWRVVNAPKPKAVKSAKSKAKAIKSIAPRKIANTAGPLNTGTSLTNKTPISRPPTDAINAAALAHTLAALAAAPRPKATPAVPLQPRALATSTSPAALTKPKSNAGDNAGCPSCALRFAHMAEGHLDPRAELQKDAVVVLGVFCIAVVAVVGFMLAFAEPAGEPRRKLATRV